MSAPTIHVIDRPSVDEITSRADARDYIRAALFEADAHARRSHPDVADALAGVRRRSCRWAYLAGYLGLLAELTPAESDALIDADLPPASAS